ncbi:MAG: zinc-binding dehydrogenase [Gammaproteobacteria bacterium]|nr:zinc-binding dehydrogenase [Gammaproteobacteria bacterium]
MEQRLWKGTQTNYPIIPGHEPAGIITVLHPDVVLDAAVGDIVAIASLNRCMQCEACRSGRINLCTGKFVGREPGKLRRIGGFAEFTVVDAWKLFPMPGSLPFDVIALAEPVACVVHSIRHSEVQLGEDVLVIGAGTMGHLHVLLARLRGARVIVSDPDLARRQHALNHGAALALSPEELVDGVRETTGGHGVDVVYVTHVDQRSGQQACEAARRGGRVLFYGSATPPTNLSVDPNHLHRSEIRLDGAVSHTLEDWLAATRLLARGLLDVSHLVSATYPIDEISLAMDHAISGSAFRVVVTA